MEASLRQVLVRAAVALVAMLAFTPALASAAASSSGVEHLHFAAGPYRVTPGANLILVDYNHVPKPTQDGFMVGMEPNLRYALPDGKCCGNVPLTSVIHLHHGVWLSTGTAGVGEGDNYGGIYPFMAAGEEKTAYEFPAGYGYPIGAHDFWFLNYMIHNLTDRAARVYITYNIDFVPASSPLAAQITPVQPIWMDVEDHHLYPVFNVSRGSGRHGKFTFPNMARDPYGTAPPFNRFTVDHPGTLIGTAGHLHPGGLYDTLDLIRSGATPRGGAMPGSEAHSVRLFRSNAHYFDRGGPISWDLAMTATAPDWRPQVKAGDVLDISSTYETRRASWYEVMGIMVVWEAWGDTRGVDPFAHRLDQRGHITHGHLAENNYHGGTAWIGVNPLALPECATKRVLIAGFRYLPGDFTNTRSSRCIPTISRGHSITFVNEDANPLGTFDNFLAPSPFYLQSIFHTVTSCGALCDRNYGISYPLATGPVAFDSGELGIGTPGVGRLSWRTPTSLPPGTYTFYCRIHPWMRGVFRVIG